MSPRLFFSLYPHVRIAFGMLQFVCICDVLWRSLAILGPSELTGILLEFSLRLRLGWLCQPAGCATPFARAIYKVLFINVRRIQFEIVGFR